MQLWCSPIRMRSGQGIFPVPISTTMDTLSSLARKPISDWDGCPGRRWSCLICDADGERLWYALSTNYQRKTTNQCKAPGDPTCLNSETPGTITVRDATGSIINDGTTPANNGSILPTGAIAVILAPGPSLTRLGDSSPQ